MKVLQKIKISERSKHAGGYAPVTEGNERRAIIVCPDCRRVYGALGGKDSKFEIQNNGKISPAFECKGCKFKSFLRLSGWADQGKEQIMGLGTDYKHPKNNKD